MIIMELRRTQKKEKYDNYNNKQVYDNYNKGNDNYNQGYDNKFDKGGNYYNKNYNNYDNNYYDDNYYNNSFYKGKNTKNNHQPNRYMSTGYEENTGYNENMGYDENLGYDENANNYNNKKGKKNKKNTIEDPYSQQQTESSAYNKGKSLEKANISGQASQNKNIDYLTVIYSLLTAAKEFIIEQIKTLKIKKAEIFIPKEVVYQLIVVIHKVENMKEIAELKSICHFGFPIEETRELKQLLNDGYSDKGLIKEILIKVEIKKILILYKFLDISIKKFKGVFYKLDLGQIDENIYSDFIYEEEKPSKKSAFNTESKEYKINNAFAQNKKKIFTSENFPDISSSQETNLNQRSKIVKLEELEEEKKNVASSFNQLFKPDKTQAENTHVQKQKQDFKTYVPPNEDKPKLKDILTHPNTSSKISKASNIKKSKPSGGMKLNKDRYDEMFPEA